MPTKTKSPTDELVGLEAVHAEALTEANRLDSEVQAASSRLRELAAEREDRTGREPRLVDHQSAPVDPDNEIGRIDREIADVGDITDLAGRARHAGAITDQAWRDVEAFMDGHRDQLLAEHALVAERARDAAEAGMRAAVAGIDNYIDVVHRTVGLLRGDRKLDGRNVPGLDRAGELKRALEYPELPVPMPDPTRRYA